MLAVRPLTVRSPTVIRQDAGREANDRKVADHHQVASHP